jgi:hypothetical protein
MPRCWLHLAASVLTLSAACGGEDLAFSGPFLGASASEGGETAPAETRPTWTILVYGHGDHDLSNALLSDLAEMASARLSPAVQLLVFADWDASRTIAGDASYFPAGAIWYRVRGQGHALERFEEGGELDFDDPAVLTAAVSRAFAEFPSERRGLVLWDHGGGWAVGFGGDSQDGTRRKAPGLATDQVAAAIQAGLQRAGLTGKQRLDFLSFDACLMGGAESISAFSDLSQVYLAEAELDYGDGWDYATTLTWLSENPTASARELAAFEVQAWDAHHRDASFNDSLLRSHVAIDNRHWPRFVSATHGLVQAEGATRAPEPLAIALQRSLPPYQSQLASPGGSQLRDIGDVLSALAGGDNRAVAAAARTALEAGRAARIAVSAGTLREGQLGVHVLGGAPRALSPAQVDLYARRARAWSGASGWGGLIDTLRAEGDGEAPTVRGEVIQPGPAPTLSFDLAAGDAARVEVALLRPESAGPSLAARSAVVLGTLASAFVQPGRYDFSWSGRVWRLTAGEVELPVTIEPWIWQVRGGQLEAPILASRGLLRSSSGEEVECVLLVDARTLEATALLLVSGDRPAVYDLALLREADPGAVFLPLIGAVDLRDGAPSAAPFSAGVSIPESGRLALRQVPAEPGDYLVRVRASDVWGNEGDTLFPVSAR